MKKIKKSNKDSFDKENILSQEESKKIVELFSEVWKLCKPNKQ